MTQKPCVYAIFSHDSPDQVLRLVGTLKKLSTCAHVVVHHDPSHTRLEREQIEAVGGIAIPTPVAAEWGDFSQVKQHLHTMGWCLDNLDFEWYVTLTGQSYPIKPLVEFESMLADSPYDAYLSHFDAYDPKIWPQGEAWRRYHFQYVKLPRFRYWHKVTDLIRNHTPDAIRLFNASQPLLQIFTFPRGLPTRLGLRTTRRPFNSKGTRLTAGNQNTNFRRNVLKTILDHVDAHPDYTDYFLRTALPDEVFFTTITCNAPGVRIANNNLRHIYWPSARAASVGVMDMRHLPELVDSPAYFALKFDQNISPGLLDTLDSRLGIRADVTAK